MPFKMHERGNNYPMTEVHGIIITPFTFVMQILNQIIQIPKPKVINFDTVYHGIANTIYYSSNPQVDATSFATISHGLPSKK